MVLKREAHEEEWREEEKEEGSERGRMGGEWEKQSKGGGR